MPKQFQKLNDAEEKDRSSDTTLHSDDTQLVRAASGSTEASAQKTIASIPERYGGSWVKKLEKWEVTPGLPPRALAQLELIFRKVSDIPELSDDDLVEFECLYKESHRSGKFFHSFLNRAETLIPEELRRMVEAGSDEVTFSIESSSFTFRLTAALKSGTILANSLPSPVDSKETTPTGETASPSSESIRSDTEKSGIDTAQSDAVHVVESFVGQFSARLKSALPTLDDFQMWVAEVKDCKFDKRTVTAELSALRHMMDLANCTFELNGHPVRIRAIKNPRSRFASLQFWRMKNGERVFEYIGTQFPGVKVIARGMDD